jgi:hypothetical protein
MEDPGNSAHVHHPSMTLPLSHQQTLTDILTWAWSLMNADDQRAFLRTVLTTRQWRALHGTLDASPRLQYPSRS